VLETKTAHGSVTVSSHTEPYCIHLRAHGTRASVMVDLATDTVVCLKSRGRDRTAKLVINMDHAVRLGLGTLAGAARVLTGRKTFGHHNLVTRFYSALEAGDPPPVSAEDGRDLVAVLDRVWDSLPGVAAETP
jgi:predicted dehydrogenase